MVELIVGKKGKGKTKVLLDKVNVVSSLRIMIWNRYIWTASLQQPSLKERMQPKHWIS